MPISGIVIVCADGCAERVAQTLKRQEGIEVHGVLPDGKIVAVVEGDSVSDEVNMVSKLHDTEGVISVSLAYHNFEDLSVEATI